MSTPLTSKQRAFLRGLANKIDPIVHVGKGEITDAINKQVHDALVVRELIKGKVLETNTMTAKEVSAIIAQSTESEVVQVMGRTFVLYRKNKKEPKIKLPR